jgi:hypothetical protein
MGSMQAPGTGGKAMKASRLFGAVLAAGLGLSAIGISSDVEAQSKKPATKKEAAPAIAAEAPMTKKPIVLEPKGLAWGMNHKQVAELYDKIFDEDYQPKYKAVSPGVKMKALDAALAEEKAAFRRSRVDFGKVPTGLDAGPLKGEYSYNNKESMLSVTRNGLTTYYFFIQDKLWKMVHEHRNNEAWGKDFQAVVTKLAAQYGVPGRVIPADPAKGKPSPEVDWKDANTHLRAVQRSETSFALIFEDNVTLSNLASLRTFKPTEDSGIDPAVAAAVGPPSPPPPDPKDAKGKGKDKAPPPPPKK